MNNDESHEPERRGYRSTLREEQAEATRERILDAAMAMQRGGVTTLAYTALAKQARVSVPTVYRHFPERKDLFDAMYHRLEGITEGSRATDEEPTVEALRRFFLRFDEIDAMAREARLSTHWEFSRAVTVPRRRASFARLVDRRLPGLPEPHRTWLIELGVVLVSSSTAESFHFYLDRSGSETADRVAFALEALLAHGQTLLPQEDR